MHPSSQKSVAGFFTLAAVFLVMALALLMLGTLRRYEERNAKAEDNRQADLAALATAQSFAAAGNAQALVNDLQLALYGLDILVGAGHALGAAAAIADGQIALSGMLLIQGYTLVRDIQKINREFAKAGDLLSTLVPQAFTVAAMPAGYLPWPIRPQIPQWADDADVYSSGFCGSLDTAEEIARPDRTMALPTGRESVVATLALVATGASKQLLDRAQTQALSKAHSLLNEQLAPVSRLADSLSTLLGKVGTSYIALPASFAPALRDFLPKVPQAWPQETSLLLKKIDHSLDKIVAATSLPQIPENWKQLQSQTEKVRQAVRNPVLSESIPADAAAFFDSLPEVIAAMLPDVRSMRQMLNDLRRPLHKVIVRADHSHSLRRQMETAVTDWIRTRNNELQKSWQQQIASLKLLLLNHLAELSFAFVDGEAAKLRKSTDNWMATTLSSLCRLGNMGLLDSEAFPLPMPTLRARDFVNRSRITLLRPGGTLGIKSVAEAAVSSPTSQRLHTRPDLTGRLVSAEQPLRLLHLTNLPDLLRGIVWPR